MNRHTLAALKAHAAARWALAALLVMAAGAAARAQVVTADVKPGQSSGEALLTGHSGAIIPYQSDSMPLGCYGCLTGGGGGCASCGGGCGDGNCGGPGCVPGRLDCCEPCEGHSMVGRLLCAIHHSICCPDPCYEPCYIPAANAGFFLDSARPLTQAKFSYSAMPGGPTPAQGGYYWSSGASPGNGTSFVAHDFVIENEFAVDRFSFFVSTPFRVVVGTGGAGYSDMRIGTKSLFLDTELMLVSFQFTTYLPTGLPTSGTGNGNVGLEPSFLFTLKIAQETYLQTQLAEWIGVVTQQSCFHYHFSLNHTLTAPRRDMKLIGTIEYGSYVFPNGPAFYDVGPGLRFHFCNKVDVGFGMLFRVSDAHYMDQTYRTELRWRF
jgi:hypothetical protein